METNTATNIEYLPEQSGEGSLISAATECRKRIKLSLQNASVAFYDLSMALLEARENNYALEWGYANFAEYAHEELDMKMRSAYYLTDIARTVRDLGISKERVQKIGWSKMKEISGVLTEKPEEQEKYLDMAENMSRRALHEAIQSEIKKTESTNKPAILRMSLAFEGDSANIISDGLSLAYGDIGKEDVNLGLTHIIGEWLLSRGNGVQGATLEDWIEYLEAAYGVKLAKAAQNDSINDILSAPIETTTEEDDKALEELLK